MYSNKGKIETLILEWFSMYAVCILNAVAIEKFKATKISESWGLALLISELWNLKSVAIFYLFISFRLLTKSLQGTWVLNSIMDLKSKSVMIETEAVLANKIFIIILNVWKMNKWQKQTDSRMQWD